MELKGAEIRNIKNLCSDMQKKDKAISMKINIPYYQRPYKWAQENIENLLDDFNKDMKKDDDNDEKKEYFVGTAVLVETKDGRYDVIDGQQRLTTMFLLTYLKFILQRAYLEEQILAKRLSILRTSFESVMDAAFMLFGEKYKEQFKDDYENIRNLIGKLDYIPSENLESYYENLLRDYQKLVFLPEKNLSDIDEYANKYYEMQDEMLERSDLCIKYNRKSYNEKLKKALSSFIVIMTESKNPERKIRVDSDKDQLVYQYVNALDVEFKKIMDSVYDKELNPYELKDRMLIKIDELINNIKFCVIITGNEKDAYTLFEVLNDRALEIEDLDLIKNLYYKWYCTKSEENEKEIDKCIEEVDEIWVENVFTSDVGKEKAKLISYFATVFFTANDKIQMRDNQVYRETLESDYLKTCREKYDSNDIKNDIYVYQMLADIFKEYKIASRNKNEEALNAEIKTDTTITYKTIHLLNALKLYGVISALINVILKRYIENNTTNGKIKLNNFKEYLEELKSEKNKYSEIHKLSFDLWRTALLSSNYEMPRKVAKQIIEKNNINRIDYSYEISSNDMDEMKKQFGDWIEEWKYGKSESDLRAKILFINLFRMEKIEDYLEKPHTIISFQDVGIHLDHLEPQKKDGNSLEKYFEPEDKNRDKYTNSIGNMMILDKKNNNEKNNQPMFIALEHYERMRKEHWMVKEIRELLSDDKYFVKNNGGFEIPNEKFFEERKNRLKKYFLAILTSKLDDEKIKL